MTNQSQPRPLVVITGGAGHVGLACARTFADHRILISDLRADAVESAAAVLRAEGLDAVGVPADITKPQDACGLASVAARMESFSVLVHAAGVAPPTPAPAIYAVNLFGTINVLDAFEPMVQSGVAGVCLASIAGHRTLGHRFDALLLEPGLDASALAQRIQAGTQGTPEARLAYAVSKRGTILQVQRRAFAWGRRGGRLLSVSPGVLGDTDMGAARQAGFKQDDSALGRLGSSREIAEVVRFAASPAASLMTGTDLLADAGFLAVADHCFDPDRRARWHALEL